MLPNKLHITNATELARAEERLSKQRAVDMYESGFLDTLEAGSFASLCAIHLTLFGEIYDFAGKVRTVNMSKGGFRFASALYLEQALTSIEGMPQSTFDDIVTKYIEMNIAHPFREGNGRSGRIWLDVMCKKELGRVVDWSRVDKEDYLLAMERSPVKDTEIKCLLQHALTDDIHNREIFLRGLDASYAYEGYATYNAQDFLSGR